MKSPRLRSVYQALFVCDAIGVPLLFYAVGSPTLGGVLLLSSVLVLVVVVVKSGALATSWLGRHTITSIRHAARFEFAKAMICAALAVDTVFGGVHVVNRYRLWRDDVTVIVLLTVAALFTIGAGLFLMRWFAAYLMSRFR
jgi:hypothetical protein